MTTPTTTQAAASASDATAAAAAASTLLQQQDPTEVELGIATYLSPDTPGFAAVLKARYSDFVVHEGTWNTIQYRTVQYSTIDYTTVQYSTADTLFDLEWTQSCTKKKRGKTHF